jgi:hypothetical protein
LFQSVLYGALGEWFVITFEVILPLRSAMLRDEERELMCGVQDRFNHKKSEGAVGREDRRRDEKRGGVDLWASTTKRDK